MIDFPRELGKLAGRGVGPEQVCVYLYKIVRPRRRSSLVEKGATMWSPVDLVADERSYWVFF